MTMTFAENEKLNTVDSANAYNMAVNYGKLADYLSLSADQVEAVQDVHSSFCADMMNASCATSDERTLMVKNAIYKDHTYMRFVLTNDQYSKYLMLLNATFNNRGLAK